MAVRLGLALIAVVVSFCGLGAAQGPCYVSIPNQGTGEACAFYGAGVSSDEDCKTFESELGRASQEATSYAYEGQEQGCVIIASGSCQAFAAVLSLQVCSDNSAQAVQQILSSTPLETGTDAPAPAPGPSVTPGECYASLTQGQNELCTLFATGLSSQPACTAAGEQIASALKNDAIKTFYRQSTEACGIVLPGPCGSFGALIGVQGAPCSQAITQQLQALASSGFYPAGAPALSQAPSTPI